MNRKMNMTGALILAAAVWLSGCAKSKPEPVSRSVFLLNTFVTVTLYDPADETVLGNALNLCSEYEQRLSKTIEDSEIYKLNHREKGQRRVEVSESTARVLEKGLEYSRISQGAFDITVEPLSTLWNFTGKNPHVPEEALIEEAREKVGYEKVRLEGNVVVFEDDDTAVDLGAIAKGFIADEMKAYLVNSGVKSAVINLGGNVLCVGEQTGGRPFRIGIEKPFTGRSQVLAAINVRDMSVVSSGVYERYFEENGVRYHHILNPKTGYPYDNGLEQVSIISSASVDGDGLSTACFALGLEDGMKLIESLDGIYAIFVTEDGKVHYTEGIKELLVQ